MKIQKTRFRGRRGFTLVELLVVIAIIAVLSALAFVMVGKARQKAYSAKTISNLRQLQAANQTHASEHSGRYVAAKGGDDPSKWNDMWFLNETFVGALGLERDEVDWNEKYIEMGQCGFPIDNPKDSFNNARFSIGINVGTKPHWAPPTFFRSSEIRDASRSVSFGDATDIWLRAGNAWKGWESDEDTGSWGGLNMAFRNNGKAAVVYFDGHAGFVTPEDLEDDPAIMNPEYRP